MNTRFLKPRLINSLLTIIVLSLPLIPERVAVPTGGYVITRYLPFFLTFTYLQMGDYYPFILMFGFILLVYSIVSIVLAILSKILSGKIKEI